MPLTIDISDVAIERTEQMHHLHLWGMLTSLWTNTCIVCAEATHARKVRCSCGDGSYCSSECRVYGKDRQTFLCNNLNSVSLKGRPSPNHRRIMIIQSEAPCVAFVWAEVKDSSLVIDHPSIDEHYKPRIGADRRWVDLAVINPAVDMERFYKIGHGIAIGFDSTMMDPRHTVEPSERNKGLVDILIPGHRAQWPGPLIFFSYGYKVSDYVKVDPEHSDATKGGAEAAMTELEIWNEVHKLRWDPYGRNEPKDKRDPRDKGRTTKDPGPAAVQPGRLVWRWKVKEHGTSMEILDILHRDCNLIVDYLEASQLNPIPPCRIMGSTESVQVIHVTDIEHPGYRLDTFWDAPEDSSTPDSFPMGNPSQVERHTKSQDLHFYTLALPRQPSHLAPMAGAFAVGLRWAVRYSMDINPPFRGNLPDTNLHGPLRDLLWTLKFSPLLSSPHPTLQLRCPSPYTDSALVTHADGLALPDTHVQALLKYLRFTDPVHWSRHGPRGFEAYWNTYSKVNPEKGMRSPYAVQAEADALARRASVLGQIWAKFRRELAHMTLEGLGAEDLPLRAELALVRAGILGMIREHRRVGGRFEVGRGPLVADL